MSCERCAMLRAALVGLVGASSREDLEAMENFLRDAPISANESTPIFTAIRTLIETDEVDHG